MKVSARVIVIAVIPDLPPLKWSSLEYGLDDGGRINGKEEAFSG